MSGLDMFDLRILRCLSQNARISVADLSKEIGLSKTPCHNRLRRLEKDGFIKGYKVILDPVKLGLDH
ncbi:MAG: winged helix-turn-helix transcriptional regulator, partial [Pseudomonadota bacterium]